MPYHKMYNKIAKTAGCDWHTVVSVLRAYSIFLENEILDGRTVWLPKIGYFSIKYHGKSRVRNVAKRKDEQILPGYYKLLFKASGHIKKFIQNSPFLQIK